MRNNNQGRESKESDVKEFAHSLHVALQDGDHQAVSGILLEVEEEYQAARMTSDDVLEILKAKGNVERYRPSGLFMALQRGHHEAIAAFTQGLQGILTAMRLKEEVIDEELIVDIMYAEDKEYSKPGVFEASDAAKKPKDDSVIEAYKSALMQDNILNNKSFNVLIDKFIAAIAWHATEILIKSRDNENLVKNLAPLRERKESLSLDNAKAARQLDKKLGELQKNIASMKSGFSSFFSRSPASYRQLNPLIKLVEEIKNSRSPECGCVGGNSLG